MITISSKGFTPHDIVMRDDALHRKDGFGRVETWYYDAMFDNKYSMVSLVNIFTIGNHGIILTGLFIYKDTKLVKSIRQRHLYRSLCGSEDKPFIKIDGKQLLVCCIDENTGKWICQISMGDKDAGVNLQFNKTSRGWKGVTPLGNWLVIPSFGVNGMIYLNGKNINVSGKGYHDHNIYPIYAPFINRSYHFGKIDVNSMSVTWTRVIRGRDNEERIVVLNREQSYTAIEPDDISFTVEKHVKDHGKMIPEVFYLKVENDLLSLNVKMETLSYHHIRMPLLNYWRYHQRDTGEIKVDDVTRKIDNVEISEFMRFF